MAYKDKDKEKARKKQYYQDHKEEMSKQQKKYREEHKDEISKQSRKYQEEHKDEKHTYNKQYYEENRVDLIEYQKQYRMLNDEYLIEYRKDYNKATRLYKTWFGMKRRCYNTKLKQYKDWGGRGITVCEEWLNDYMVFKKWAVEHGYAPNLTIDRIDNDGNYEPSNCQWLTKSEHGKKSVRDRAAELNP